MSVRQSSATRLFLHSQAQHLSLEVTGVTTAGVTTIDPLRPRSLNSQHGVVMKDIHEVLRRKQAKFAQLSKQIEALQQAAEKLREVAPLLAENEDEESSVLAEVEEQGNSMAAVAGSASAGAATPAKPARAPRWP